MIGRRTHDYPHGKPSGLVFVEIAAGVVCLLWLAFALRGWVYAALIAGLFFSLGFLRSRLLKKYEYTGEAVRIPRPIAVVFTAGTPGPICLLRIAFFVVVPALLLFGIAPLPDPIRKTGVISSVIGLFVIGFLHFWLERHYVSTGRAEEQYNKSSRV